MKIIYHYRFQLYLSLMIAFFLIIIIPINISRLYLIYKYNPSITNIAIIGGYVQSLSICCMESHFIYISFSIYLKLCIINEELGLLKSKIMVDNKYPIALRSNDFKTLNNRIVIKKKTVNNLGMAYSLEILRIRHGFIRIAINDLNNLFDIQLGLSLCVLSVMILFNMYNENFHASGTVTRSKLIFYGWLFQSVFRFVLINIIAHYTIQEALKAKILITDMNNRYLDNNFKYELQLFLSQINNSSLDFKAYDCFNLNIHLITSAITVGITYLFMLIQFRLNSHDVTRKS
ncbi:uncharacterized protein LOC126900407 isoform X2 [Daktulosphaira vitifoliae]|nr:uncharacterized protein LOC126900407 isoform X2 [Daktulosphaira vitifoliae]